MKRKSVTVAVVAVGAAGLGILLTTGSLAAADRRPGDAPQPTTVGQSSPYANNAANYHADYQLKATEAGAPQSEDRRDDHRDSLWDRQWDRRPIPTTDRYGRTPFSWPR
jgi:hypothetical protein